MLATSMAKSELTAPPWYMSASTVRDGSLPVGSFDITVLENATVPFVLNSFTRTPAAKKLVSLSARGVPSRQRNIAGQIAFTADCQVPDESTAGPRINQTFAVDADRDGVAEPYQFDSDAGDAYTQDGETKMKVSGMAMVTPLIFDNTTPATPVAFAPASHASTVIITPVNLSVYKPRDVTVTGSTYSATGLPTGLSIAAATGIITGTPTTPGTYAFTIKCTGTRTVSTGIATTTETVTGLITGSWVIT